MDKSLPEIILEALRWLLASEPIATATIISGVLLVFAAWVGVRLVRHRDFALELYRGKLATTDELLRLSLLLLFELLDRSDETRLDQMPEPFRARTKQFTSLIGRVILFLPEKHIRN